MDYVESVQNMFYQDRIGTVYGCFEVIAIRYDKEIKKQVWTLRCTHCGLIKETHNGKDYVKGKNHGICKCQHVKKVYFENRPKIKKAKMQDHELYCRWETIKSRCYYPKDKDYHNYGGRGIQMCDEWKNDFYAFVKWAESNGYSKELTIDRIDSNGDYTPENCRWVSRYLQNKNKRNVKLYDGLTLPDYCKKQGLSYQTVSNLMGQGMSLDAAVAQLEEHHRRRAFNDMCRSRGIEPETVKNRMKKGASLEEALDEHYGQWEIDGVYKSKADWCKEYGLTVPAVDYRMKVKGMSFKEAVTTPKSQGVKGL